MGSWRLEAFKMGIYMLFPVGAFWLFNQPKIFEGWIMENRKLLFPPEDPKAREELQQMIERMDLERQLKLEEQMKEATSRRQAR